MSWKSPVLERVKQKSPDLLNSEKSLDDNHTTFRHGCITSTYNSQTASWNPISSIFLSLKFSTQLPLEEYTYSIGSYLSAQRFQQMITPDQSARLL